MRVVVILFLLCTSWNSRGQDPSPVGRFLSDSILLGYPVKYALTSKHAPESQILFPDSGYNFSPFELIDKEYYPTTTIHDQSFDSAVYIFRSFNLKPSQSLALPVFIAENGDSTALYSEPDSVNLKEYLAGLPLHTDFREDTGFSHVRQDFNYPYVLFYLAVALLIAFVIYFFFGKILRRRYRLIIIRIDHNNFLKNFQRLQNEFNSSKEPFTIERTLTIWKAYLARLENKPINTYTTTEIINLYDQEELKDGLNVIDRAIYGGLISNEAEKAIITLRRFSIRQYHKRKRELYNV